MFVCSQIKAIIDKLPRLTEADLERSGHHGASCQHDLLIRGHPSYFGKDSSCSICLNTLLASIAEEEMAYVMDSPAQPVEDLGVTRLAGTCEHVFCRKE